jgi:hypothetical protein
VREVIIGILLCVLTPIVSHAQEFSTEQTETKEEPVKIKEPRKSYIKGLRGIDSLSTAKVIGASLIVPGYSQAYNKQYWKIPVIYGVGAAMIYGGAHSNSMYKKTGDQKYRSQGSFYYAGAGLVYLSSLIDGVASYKTHREGIVPIKATLFSTFLPGLGQAYNGDYWKIPVIYGGLAFAGYWLNLNNMQYTRYRNAYNAEYDYSQGLTETPSEFNGRLSLQSLKNYRDNFRRNRDYAVLYMFLAHAINIIDATVFAQLSNFDVGEDLSLKITPALIPSTDFYSQSGLPAIGFNLKINLNR